MAKIHTIRAMFAGASNNGGNDGGNGNPADWLPLVRQVVWNNSCDPNITGTKFIANQMDTGPHDQATGNVEAPSPWAMKYMLDQLWPTVRYSQAICHTNPGAINPWVEEGGVDYDILVANHAASKLPPMDYFAWIQGGTEAASETVGSGAWDTLCETTYPTKWTTMITGLKADGVLAQNVRIALVGLSLPEDPSLNASRSAFNTDCFIPLAAATPNCVYVDVDSIATRGYDNVHYPSAGYKDLGQRIGVAFLASL